MNSMLAAIQKRKHMGQEGDHADMSHESGHTADQDKGADLHSFVSSLSEGQKHQLKTILENAKNTGQEIAKGGPSTEEQGKIKDNMAEENGETDLEATQERGLSSDEHDEIGKSMLDSRYLGGNPPSHQPRNLGERVKMDIHKKLKEKGKI